MGIIINFIPRLKVIVANFAKVYNKDKEFMKERI